MYFVFYILTKTNFVHRLAQLRETGIQARIRQQYITSTQQDTQPSSIVVSLVTIAPILVLLAAGNIIGIVILMIERCVHADIFKTCPLMNIR